MSLYHDLLPIQTVHPVISSGKACWGSRLPRHLKARLWTD